MKQPLRWVIVSVNLVVGLGMAVTIAIGRAAISQLDALEHAGIKSISQSMLSEIAHAGREAWESSITMCAVGLFLATINLIYIVNGRR